MVALALFMTSCKRTLASAENSRRQAHDEEPALVIQAVVQAALAHAWAMDCHHVQCRVVGQNRVYTIFTRSWVLSQVIASPTWRGVQGNSCKWSFGSDADTSGLRFG